MEKEYHKLTIKPINPDINVIEDPQGDCHRLTSKTNTLTVSHREQPTQETINFILGMYKKGVGISNIEKTSTVGLVDTYTITYTDGTTTTFDVTNGIEGGDGRGIVSILKTSTQELTDTYTITYTDDTTSTFDVTNGVDGVSVESITLYETVGLVDTYEIIYSTGSRSYFNVTNGADGKGIVSIIKTSTVGLVDTYTVTYSDATTSTFEVTNGEKGDTGTSAYEIYIAGGGTLSEVEFNASITNIPTHIADETIHHTIEELDGLYEPIITYPTENPETKFYRGDKVFSTIAVGGGGWRANVYMQTSNSDVSGYKEILYTLEATETEIATTLTNTTVLTQTYLYPNGIEVDMLPAGQWGFSETNKISSLAGAGQITILYEVFARHLDNSETNLFTIESNPVTWTIYTEMRSTKSIMGYEVLPTDRIGFRRSVISTYTNSKTLTYIVGDGRGSYMNTTVATRHKELRGLNEDEAFQHIDNAVQFSGTIDEVNDKLAIWDESQNKWIEFSFTEFKTFLASYHLKLDQTTPQTLSQSPKITSLTAGQLVYVNADKQLVPIPVYWDFVNNRMGVGANNTRTFNITGIDTQFRINYDAANYVDIQCSSTGNLNLRPLSGRAYYVAASKNNAIYIYDYTDGSSSYSEFSGSVIILRKQNISNVQFQNNGNGFIMGNLGLGTTTPKSKLQVAGGIQCGDDTAAASADKVGTTRYRATANASYVEMCMQTGATTFVWHVLATYSW